MAMPNTFRKVMPSGRDFNFADPQPDMICLDDIVHCLARTNRWGGNIEPMSYSVAQHSLVTASAVKRPASRVYALLHDAAEAYIGDLPTPFKLWVADAGADIIGLEMRILYGAIFPALGIEPPSPEIAADVHDADQAALATEFRDIVKGRNESWSPKAPPLKTRIKFQPVVMVEDAIRAALRGALQPYNDAAGRGQTNRGAA